MAEWRPIPGYEGTYDVSSDGQVHSRPRPRTKGGILRQRVNKRGYLALSLVQHGVQKTHEVHRLVALAFLGPRPAGMEVRHLNGDQLDPRLSNLAYGTPPENKLDTVAHGTHPQSSKTHCPRGHPYDAQNIYVLPSRPTARYCRTCKRERERAR